MHQGSRDQTRTRELFTLMVRLTAFVATLIPLVAMMQPWVTLDGIDAPVSGIGAVALLLPSMREYLYAVSPVQAAVVTLGPIPVALLAILISNNYRRRKSVFWAPPAMLVVALGIAFGATDLVTGTEQGLTIVIVVSMVLTPASGCHTRSGRSSEKVDDACGIPGADRDHGNGALPLERMVGTVCAIGTQQAGGVQLTGHRWHPN